MIDVSDAGLLNAAPNNLVNMADGQRRWKCHLCPDDAEHPAPVYVKKHSLTVRKNLWIFLKKPFQKHLMSQHSATEERAIYLCKHCPYKFTTNAELRQHMNSDHADRRPHECPKCHRRFTQRNHLKRHMDNVRCMNDEDGGQSNGTSFPTTNHDGTSNGGGVMKTENVLAKVDENNVPYRNAQPQPQYVVISEQIIAQTSDVDVVGDKPMDTDGSKVGNTYTVPTVNGTDNCESFCVHFHMEICHFCSRLHDNNDNGQSGRHNKRTTS